MVKFKDQLKEEIGERSRRRRKGEREVAEARLRAQAPRNDLLPGLQVVQVAIEQLTAPAHVVRKLVPAQVERLVRAIETFGFVVPILALKSGEIVKGRTRVEAANRLGLGTVPCIFVDHLTDEEIRALRIALGRLAETGEWDFEALSLEIGELMTLDAPLEATGFTFPELDALTLLNQAAADVDEVPEPDPGPPVTKPGQMWRLGPHRIICGDARDPEVYAALLNEDQVRLVLTDVPFNVKISGHVTSGEHREFAMASGEMSDEEFGAFNRAWMEVCLSRLIPGGLLGTFIDWRSVELILATGRELGLELLNLVVWAKTNGGMGSLWRSQHELLPMFKKPGDSHVNNVELGKHGRWRSNVWEYPGASSLGSDARKGLTSHPTVKPVALLEDALLDVTLPNDLVLEPFAGSGSTLIACQTIGRPCRAIEIDPAYVDVVVRRWQALTGEDAVCEETSLAFDDLAEQVRAESDPERRDA